MSDFYNDDLRKLAKRAHCEMMNSEDSFVQGFIMGRQYQDELRTQIYSTALREAYASATIKYQESNWWNDRIDELEKEVAELKSKYVYTDDL